MCDDKRDDVQPPALSVVDAVVAVVTTNVAESGCRCVSGPPAQQSTRLPPVTTARLSTFRSNSCISLSTPGTRPPNWRRHPTPRVGGSSVVTFAPSTRFDECRQRTNVAVRRTDDMSHFALPALLPESSWSSLRAPVGCCPPTVPRTIGPSQPRIILSNSFPVLPRETSFSAPCEDLRAASVDDGSDTWSSADSACSTTSSSMTYLDSDTFAVRPRTPPSLVLESLRHSVALQAPSDFGHSTLSPPADSMSASAVAAVVTAIDAAPPSPTGTTDVLFTLLESERPARTTTLHLTETGDSLDAVCQAAAARAERSGVALVRYRRKLLSTHPTEEAAVTTLTVRSPSHLESISLTSSPEETAPIIPLVLLPPSPKASLFEWVNSRGGPATSDTPKRQLRSTPPTATSPNNNVELLVSDAARTMGVLSPR